jgi:CheY-like chemotaxis protein
MKELANHPFHLFVVDDDKDDQVFFTEAIKTALPNTTVTCFSDGTEVMKCLYDEQIIPDLIFLDLKMHKQGGRETLVLIKQNEFFFEIPVVILTSSTSMKERMSVIDLGANGYYNKPASLEDMVKVVEKVAKSWLKKQVHRAL